MSAPRLITTLSALLAIAAMACSKEAPIEKAPLNPVEPEEPWQQPSVNAEGTVEDAPADLRGGDMPGASRGVRRMRIDTLQASMTKVAGLDVNGDPIVWRFNNQNGFSDAAFGKALGRPDYQTSTDESTVSNALYLKFVGDAARDICTQMAKNDMKRTSPASRALFPKANVDGNATETEVTENLRYLVLRFLGVRVEATDPMITNLRAVYDAGVSSVATPNGGELTAAAEGWRGVCVTLFESPLFHND